MKHSSFKFICLIIWASITVFSAYGQQPTTAQESMILESFNGGDNAPYIWKTESSRFISPVRDSNGVALQDNNGNARRYPIVQYVDTWPVAGFGFRPAETQRSLGIHGRFDRQGYNWIDIYPVLADDADEKPYEIHIPGKVQSLDMWVWGSNYRYYIEVFVRDYRGVIFPLKLGDINYLGWQNLRVNIPTYISQSRSTLPSYAGLSFVKFRIWTQPTERVNDFHIYFKQLKILTDTFLPFFDGNDLADPAYVNELWGN
ncbi:MAG: flagellar filament outer layer protein FlaA [Treponema sp.]|nr:flagellar filament outer layer protein FlaA [Treponema sp.]